MKYRPGDKVKIKSLDWYNENKNDFGLIFCNNICFDEKMIEFCGKTVTIVAQRDNKYYFISEDNCLSFWSEDMIEGIADESQDKMVSLDKVCEMLRKTDTIHYMENGKFLMGKFVDDFRKVMEK